MSSVITVKDMCLWYGQVQALKNININIEGEEYYGADWSFWLW